MNHVEDQCEHYEGQQLDDKAKSYGRWFQTDVFDKDYRFHVGRRFGLDYEGSWVMKAPSSEKVDEPMDKAGGEPLEKRELGQEKIPILDLNETIYDHGSGVNNMALLPFMLKEQGRQHPEHMDESNKGMVTGTRHPLMLFGSAIEPSVGDEGAGQEEQGVV